MFETVSVDDALKRGQRTVNIPVLFIIIAGFGAAIWMVSPLRLSQWFILVGVLSGFVLAWLYWSVAIVRWRLWAFDNVRNVHELKKRAVKDKLIWSEGSLFAKTEIWSAEQRAKWESLQYKFEQEDIFNDDLSISVETRIGFSKPTAILLILMGLGMIAIAYFYLLSDEKARLLGFVLIAFGLFFAIKSGINYFDKRPRIILSNEGVETKKIKFYSWQQITGEDTKVVQHGKSSTTYFIYNSPEGQHKISLSELAIGKHQFEKLLRIYRGRYEHGVGRRTDHRSTVI